jgi:hypothetical protein
MLGPSASGKTTLLAAIKRACEQPSEDGVNYEFIAELETAGLISSAIDKITDRARGLDATASMNTYPFEVHVSAKSPHFWSPPLEAALHVVMTDSGGGTLLPAAMETMTAVGHRPAVIRTAIDASCMILCVDITRPGVVVLEKNLAVAFAEITQPRHIETPVHWKEQMWNRLRRRPAPTTRFKWRRCLNADRFLLMLTQVDKLCYRLPPTIERTIRFAQMIDPVEHARDLLGVPLLRMIHSALKPGAIMAVGVTSSYGFHPLTGDSFADTDGTPINLASESGEDILRRWTPYGIRDALYFLATGQSRGTVKQVMPADLTAGAEPLEFTYATEQRGEM